MNLKGLLHSRKLNEVFTPGGQPSITYVDRGHLGLEASLRKAVALPSTIVSLTGQTKCGKTVLCKNVLGKYEYVWIDGGQIKTETDIWGKICNELKLASELVTETANGTQAGTGAALEGGARVPGAHISIGLTVNGSRLNCTKEIATFVPDNMSQAIDVMVKRSICLVIDDFHYVDDGIRSSFIKSIKGAIFRGLKVVLLSTPHRAFEAIKAESEITGRFKHVTVPPWSTDDLKLIAITGFNALNVKCASSFIKLLASESEGSPLLMQRFCWNVCYDNRIEETLHLKKALPHIDTNTLFNEVAADAGLPIYERLVKGPQSRTVRIRRPLFDGRTADIYEAILLAVAKTGPKERLSYDNIRAELTSILREKVPQKIEVSNALHHLAEIDISENKGQRAIDWDSQNLTLVLTDPFFRFYLRWQIASDGPHNVRQTSKP
jgi:hypothetical protein